MKKNNAFQIILLALIIGLSIACIAAFVMLCVRGADPTILIHKEKPKQESQSPYELEETFDYGDGYLKSIIFIGDKTIRPIADAIPSLSPDQVWTGADGTLQLDYAISSASIMINGEPIPIESALEQYSPKYVIITVGIENGVNHCTEEKFKEYYQRLVNTVKDASPETDIILQSIFPVSKSAEKNDPSISNSRIDNANSYIRSIAENLSVRYLNTAEILKNGEGYLDTKYDSGDGIILNQDGYLAVENYIRTHGYK